MGLTLIRKSQNARRKRNPHIALVLAGGAVSGGAFKVGGLKALDDFLVGGRGISDFDTYVGLSAGSVLAVPLAAGIGPAEMIRVLDGSSRRFNQLRPIDFYTPNWTEFYERPAKFAYDLFAYWPGLAFDLARSLPDLPEAVREATRDAIRRPGYTSFERLVVQLFEHLSPTREIPALSNHIPSGLFDSIGLERWLRTNLQRIRMPNDFGAFTRRRKRGLYICATDLDTAERVVFGADENSELSISQAVQASVSIPGFYRPARLNGIDYVDGGLRHTANIDVAIEKGADLVICYNPFRPFINRIDDEAGGEPYFANGRYLADRGLKVVINQAFRTLLHSRLKLGLQQYMNDDSFTGDIVLLEPRERDASYFATNPLAFWKRGEAVRHGFESVRRTIEQNFEPLSELMSLYGLEMCPDTADRRAARLRDSRGWTSIPDEELEEEEPQLEVARA